MSKTISIEEILITVKEVRNNLIGISRSNKPLYDTVNRKLNKLEGKLVAAAEGIVTESLVEDNSKPELPESPPTLIPPLIVGDDIQQDLPKSPEEEDASGEEVVEPSNEESESVTLSDPLADLLNKDAEEDGTKLD